MWTSEDINDYREELESEGERHFIRNLQESGYELCEIYELIDLIHSDY